MNKKQFVFIATLGLFASLSNSYAHEYENSDYTDLPWSVNTISNVSYTQARIKNDNSPVYFYVSNLNNSFYANVVNGNGMNPSISRNYFVKRPGKYCLSSYIYEDHQRKVACKVKITKTTKILLSANGLWSPDSQSCPY